ncbi:MAG: iron-containing alcohol dehydrogenase [Eubacteriaceae bacterium]|nr:iron-containing alcohol dehydrogenase [Eubacteriaceae bacterium]MDD4508869.1 iron-containing alcohol dehydrogenase [Eubacteriaceae bacterium]
MKEMRFNKDRMMIGPGALSGIKAITGQRFFIVSGESSMVKNGAIGRIKDMLKEDGRAYDVYLGIDANPTVDVILKGTERMKAFDPDVVLAIGGGSAIDAAKVMSLLCDYPTLTIEEIREGKAPVKRKKIMLVAAPSTSGTASEVTWAAVATFPEEKLKVGLKTPAFIPDIAILDGELTLSMPQKVMVESGMDALTHALESYINKGNNTMCKAISKAAAEGLFSWLPQSFESGDIISRQKVHEFQSLAGLSFSNSGLGMDHGIAHAFGGQFNLSHGLLNAIALPYVLRYNSRDASVREDLDILSQAIGGDVIERVEKFKKQFGVPESFKAMGLSEEDFNAHFETLLDNSLKGSTVRNPVPMTRDEMERVLKSVYDGQIRFTEEQ